MFFNVMQIVIFLDSTGATIIRFICDCPIKVLIWLPVPTLLILIIRVLVLLGLTEKIHQNYYFCNCFEQNYHFHQMQFCFLAVTVIVITVSNCVVLCWQNTDDACFRKHDHAINLQCTVRKIVTFPFGMTQFKKKVIVKDCDFYFKTLKPMGFDVAFNSRQKCVS